MAAARRGAALLCLLLAMTLLRSTAGPVDALLCAASSWMAAHGVLGALAYAVFFVLAFMAFFPSTPLELLAGHAFGFSGALGMLLVLKPLAQTLTFLAARRLGVSELGTSMRGRAKFFDAVELEIRQNPAASWRLVFLVCLAYFPCGVKVYGLAALPSVRPHVFSICAAIAAAPFCVVHAWMGSSARDLQHLLHGGSNSLAATGAHQAADTAWGSTQLRLTMLGAAALLGCVFALGIHGKRMLLRLAQESRQCPDNTALTV